MVVMTARSSAHIFGRDEDLQTLAALVGIEGGRGHVILSGDAGVGKTRLLQALRDRATGVGWKVRAAGCLDFGESALPYQAISDLLGVFARAEPERVAAIVEQHPALERLLPDRPSPSPMVGENVDRTALFGAVVALLEDAALDAPLLITIEDLHWADQSTRDLLAFVLARSLSGRVSIVGSYRGEDVNRRHPLRAHLAQWSRLPSMGRMSLGPLGEDAARRLIDDLAPGRLDEPLVSSIVSRAEGNAFFIEELVASDCGGAGLPGQLADVLLVSLDQLSDDARHVARLVSVAGHEVSHELLATACTLPGAAFEGALREAVDANLLVAQDAAYAFRHALVGEAAYDDLLPGERVAMHRQYIRAMTEGGVRASAAELALHAWRARDMELTLTAAIAAGDESMTLYGPQDAARHYEHALEFATDERTNVPELVIKTANALGSSGDPQRAVQLLADHLARRAEDTPGRSEMLVAYVRHLNYTETELDTQALAAEAVDLAAAGTEARARALAVYASVLWMRGMKVPDPENLMKAEAVAVEGLALAGWLGLGGVVADLTSTLTRLRGAAGADLRTALGAALEQAEAASDEEAARKARWLLAMSYQSVADWTNAAEGLNAILVRDPDRPWAPYVLDARWQLALLRYQTGEWDAAQELLDPAFEPGVPRLPRAMLQPIRLQIAYGRGADVLEDARALRAMWSEEGAVAVYSAGLELEVHADRADVDAALETFDTVNAILSALWRPQFAAGLRLAAQTLEVLVRAASSASPAERIRIAAEAARIEEEGRLVAKAHDWEIEGRMWLARLDAAALQLRHLSGEDAPSREDLMSACTAVINAASAMGNVAEEARACAAYARFLKQIGERSHARELAGRASVIATRVGWSRLLRQLGTADDVAPAERGPMRLTSRERDVLALVAAGHSNGEIGKQLFISTKTASVHVSNILAKLGASSRTEAAAIARERGLLSATG